MFTKNELYELKTAVGISKSFANGEYRAFLQGLENKLNTLLEQGKGQK